MTDEPEISSTGEVETSQEADGEALGASLEFGFIGNPTTKPDERGRLKMPAEFKAFIDKKYGKGFSSFYITSRDGETAEIYPMPEWQKLQARIFQMPKSDPVRKKLLDVYNLYGDRAEMDPQGRLLFPEELRQTGMLTGEVKVSGEGTLLRVTSLKKLRERVLGNPFTPQEMDLLARYDV